jgi:hypothetical protein
MALNEIVPQPFICASEVIDPGTTAIMQDG